MRGISRTITLNLSRRTLAILLIALSAGYFIGNFFPIISRGGNESAAKSLAPLSIPSFAPFSGSDSAKVNIVEFGDYQCPFCERFFQQTEPQLIQNYINSGKVRFYFLDFAFLGPDSQTLAQGAWCANDQGKYYDYHDYIYSHQGQENTGWATLDKVKSMVANISGMDIQQFGTCLDSQKYSSRVQENTQLGYSMGVGGTPTVFIGNSQIGYVAVVGSQPYALFQQAIDAQLSKG